MTSLFKVKSVFNVRLYSYILDIIRSGNDLEWVVWWMLHPTAVFQSPIERWHVKLTKTTYIQRYIDYRIQLLRWAWRAALLISGSHWRMRWMPSYVWNDFCTSETEHLASGTAKCWKEKEVDNCIRETAHTGDYHWAHVNVEDGRNILSQFCWWWNHVIKSDSNKSGREVEQCMSTCHNYCSHQASDAL